MRAFVLDLGERSVRIENVRRKGDIIFRGDGEYAMRGVSWGWDAPAYPRGIFALQFIPFIGPIIARKAFLMQTNVFIAPGIPCVLEPRFKSLDPPLTDEQALSIMEAHAEAMSLGRKGISPMAIVAIGAIAIAFLAVVSLIL